MSPHWEAQRCQGIIAAILYSVAMVILAACPRCGHLHPAGSSCG